MLVVQLCLTLGYVGIEILSRYLTFRFYTKQQVFNDADYFCWNIQTRDWDQI